MRHLNFEVGAYYHIYNRGVEKRPLFEDDGDRVRFMENIRRFKTTPEKPHLDLPPQPQVTIIAYTLLDNHFHFLLRQEAEDGVTTFMHQLGTAYTMYFNPKVDRSGRLYEGPFKAKEIEKTALPEMTAYIHLNLLWHQHPAVPLSQRFERIRAYVWSSCPDYMGWRNGTLCDKQEVWAQISERDYQVLVNLRLEEMNFELSSKSLIER